MSPPARRSSPWRLAALIAGGVLLVGLALAAGTYLVVRSVTSALVTAAEQAERPAVRVVVQYPGASAEEVERAIAVPLEAQLNGIEGMVGMRSESRTGECLVTLYFGP